MKIQGNVQMQAPRGDVFRSMTDPKTLSKAIQGCQKLDQLENNEYEMTLKIGIAAVTGTYSGRIRLLDVAEPDSFKMVVESRGAPGAIKAVGDLRFADEGDDTKVFYVGDVQVSGKVAAVGNRFLGMIANMLIGKFFDEMGKQAHNEFLARRTS